MAGALEGKRILITRAREQAGPFARRIQERGGVPVRVPVLSFRRSNNPQIHAAVDRLDSFQWIVFTSANGVRFFFKRLQEINQRIPRETRVAVVGKKTRQEIEKYGVTAAAMPEAYVGESLVDKLLDVTTAGDSVLFPCGNLAKSTVTSGLRQFGLNVTDLVVYETVLNRNYQTKLVELLQEKCINVVTFTSSSTVDHFIKLLDGVNWRDLLRHVDLACIGPVTAKTLKSYRLEPDIIAEQYSVDGLVNAIERFLRR